MKILFASMLCGIAIIGCSSSPKTSYYQLSSDPIPLMAANSNSVSVMVGPLTLPASMDRPQLVMQSGANDVQIYEYHRWAGSLKGDAGRVIAANLAVSLSTPNVWNFSQSTQNQFDYQVLIDVQSLELSPDQNIVLDVLWTIKPNAQNMQNGLPKKALNANTMMGRSLVREPLEDKGFDEFVAAQSRAFRKVGGDIAKRFPSNRT
jgi:uncharacterized protein